MACNLGQTKKESEHIFMGWREYDLCNIKKLRAKHLEIIMYMFIQA